GRLGPEEGIRPPRDALPLDQFVGADTPVFQPARQRDSPEPPAEEETVLDQPAGLVLAVEDVLDGDHRRLAGDCLLDQVDLALDALDRADPREVVRDVAGESLTVEVV